LGLGLLLWLLVLVVLACLVACLTLARILHFPLSLLMAAGLGGILAMGLMAVRGVVLGREPQKFSLVAFQRKVRD